MRSCSIPLLTALSLAACPAPSEDTDVGVEAGSDDEVGESTTDSRAEASSDTETSTEGETSSDTDTGTDTETSSDTEASTEGDTGTETETGGGPACGDGVVEGDEACDDGNTLPGDGCGPNCMVSGTALWEVFVSGENPGPDSFREIAVDQLGHVAVVGYQHPGVRWYGRFDGSNGDMLWGEVWPGQQAMWDVGTNSGELIALAISAGTPIDSARLVTFDGDGVMGWQHTLPMDSAFTSVVLTPEDDVIVGGHVENVFHLRRYDSEGNLEWIGPEMGDSAFDLALRPDGSIVAATVGSPPRVVSISAQGEHEWTAAPLEWISYYAELTADEGGRAYVVGYEGSPAHAAVVALDTDGSVLWTWVDEEEGQGWGIMSTGQGLLAGGERFGRVQSSGWLGWFDLDGELTHEQLIAHPDFPDFQVSVRDLERSPDGYGILGGVHYQPDEAGDMWLRKFEL